MMRGCLVSAEISKGMDVIYYAHENTYNDEPDVDGWKKITTGGCD